MFSEKNKFNLIEDIPCTFTKKDDKDLNNFNGNFRLIATCKSGEKLKLPETLINRCTIIACEPYNKDEKSILDIQKVKDDEIDEIKDLASKF